MNVLRYLFAAIIVTTTVILPQDQPVKPESSEFTYNLQNTAENIYSAVTSSVGWYDIPAAVYLLSKKRFVIPDDRKPFTVAPFGLDRSVANNVGEYGRKSVGSMDQNKIPSLIMYTRLGYNVALNLISPEDASRKEYQHLFLMYKSINYTATITEISKRLIYRQRPDGSDSKSFFSGHTSSTFAAATFLYRETDDLLDNWHLTKNDDDLRTALKVASFSLYYGWAGYVAYSRMADKKHYLTDVLLGAAVGTVISNLFYDAYLTDDDEKSVLDNFSLGYYNDGPAVNFSLKF